MKTLHLRHAISALILSLALLGTTHAQDWNPSKDAGPQMPANRFSTQSDWWKRAVFYELYPRSFADSNNDGTGDLNGITARLDYLKTIGVDAVWITPCFPSPQIDFGYDVSDYRSIDSKYGTLADMDRLIAEANKRGIKILLDLVVNHTSNKHEWFAKSSASKDNPYRNYFIWRDGNAPGVPPNNWTSAFGGPSWKFDERTGQWYYHFFYPEQPDLNWRNPKVEKEVFDVARFWYKRGIYGFRLDAVDTLYEDPKLKDNPPEAGVDPYGLPNQQHIYDKNLLNEVHAALQRLRKVSDEYKGRVLVGETWTSTPEQLAEYYGPKNNELQMPMYFNFMMVDRLDPATFRDRINAVEHNSSGGWPVYVLSNHDRPRYIDRYGDGTHNDQIAKLMAAMLLTLRGTPILYYGDELGMNNNDPKRPEDVQDPKGRLGWPKDIGRDGERTPMQWNSTVNAGFNQGAKPWLPVHPNYPLKNVKTELADSNSILNWFRQLIALRRSNSAFYDGTYIPLNPDDKDVLVYARKSRDKTALIALNMSNKEHTIAIDPAKLGSDKATVLATTMSSTEANLKHLKLEPFAALVLEIK